MTAALPAPPCANRRFRLVPRCASTVNPRRVASPCFVPPWVMRRSYSRRRQDFCWKRAPGARSRALTGSKSRATSTTRWRRPRGAVSLGISPLTASIHFARMAKDDHFPRAGGRSLEVPDWIVVPGGNHLGERQQFRKAFYRTVGVRIIPRAPAAGRDYAAGATLFQLYEKNGLRWNNGEPRSIRSDALLSRSRHC